MNPWRGPDRKPAGSGLSPGGRAPRRRRRGAGRAGRNGRAARVVHDRVEDPAAAGWELVTGSGFPEAIGAFWMRRGEGAAEGKPVYGVLTDPRHNNGRGVVHGGILASIMDHALGKTVRAAVAPLRCATIQLDLQYLAPVHPGEFVEARGEVVRKTRSVVFVRGHLTAGGREVLSASGLWKVLESSRGNGGGEGGVA